MNIYIIGGGAAGIMAAIYAKEKDNLVLTLMKSQPVVATYFKKLELIKVVDNKLFFAIDNKLAHDYLNQHKVKLTAFISKYFRLELSLVFSFKESGGDNGRGSKRTNRNPTMQDIQKELPDLAKFIELSGATVTPVKSRE